ncbi:MAG: 30S ribosomal protein S12 methylthiotransferase RimO [Bacteroidetes bacterium]|nr:30S ribosomal protein S12 methylthiotransferase RimO [Bacteroidota bacterium]
MSTGNRTIKNKVKVNLISLGCSKNLVDSEVLLRQFEANNLHITDEPAESDIIVVNTCGFIQDAKDESIQTILEAAQLKETGKVQKLLVMGCLSQRYSDELKKEIPEVDGFFGVTDYASVLKAIGVNLKYELIGERKLTTPSHFSYLKISEGCDNPCSFCAIPLMRRNHKSKSTSEIISEAQFLASKGVKELILIGQDTTYYGLDLLGKRELAQLLQLLCKVNGIEWIRLMYAYPAHFPMNVLDVIAGEEKICKYIDLPVQHISDEVLKSMRRGISKRKTYELIETIKLKIPGIALRTTLITGYPNENEDSFSELVEFVRDIEFDRLGVFTYSKEENTSAFDLEDPIPDSTKRQRRDMIMELQKDISLSKNQLLENSIVKVIVDDKINSDIIARTEKDAPEIDNEVIVKSIDGIKVGNFYNVKITDSTEYELYGEVVK